MGYLKHEPLSKFEYAQLVLEQNGLCGSCVQKLVLAAYKTRDEHLHQRATGGKHDLKNRSIWCVPCAKAKDKRDGTDRKKLRSLTKVTKKSQKPKAKIQSRGFNKKLTKGFDGKVRAR